MMLTSNLCIDLLMFVTGLMALLYFYTSRNYDYWKKRGVPYIKPYPFCGSCPEIFTLKTAVGIAFRDLHLEAKDPFVGFFLLDKPQLLVRDSALMKTVLIEGFNHFLDRNAVSKGTHDTIGSNMLFLMTNPEWSIYRRKITPVYTSGKLKAMFGLFEEVGSDFVSYLTRKAETTDTLDFKAESSRFSVQLISSTGFGLEANAFTEETSDLYKVATKIMDFGNPRRAIAISCFMFLPTLVDLFRIKFINQDTASFFRHAFWKTLKKREDSQTVRHDFIDILIQMKKSGMLDNDDFDGDKMLAQAVQFFLGAYETTSTTIGFALYELAKNPEMQTKLREELQDILQVHGRLSYEQLHNKSSEYLSMVINETLRKYPAVPFLDRCCNKDFPIPGTDQIIEKGVGIYISLVGLHMDPENFPNPEKFDPERFSEENIEKIKPFTYLPFGDGPRHCIGSRFGLLATQYAIASVILNFEVGMSEATPRKMEFHRVAALLSPLNHKIFLKYKKLKQM